EGSLVIVAKPDLGQLSKLRLVIVREDSPVDSHDLTIERRHHLLSEVGVKRPAESVVRLFPEVRHPKGAERHFLHDVCQAHSVRPNAKLTDDEERAKDIRIGT